MTTKFSHRPLLERLSILANEEGGGPVADVLEEAADLIEALVGALREIDCKLGDGDVTGAISALRSAGARAAGIKAATEPCAKGRAKNVPLTRHDDELLTLGEVVEKHGLVVGDCEATRNAKARGEQA